MRIPLLTLVFVGFFTWFGCAGNPQPNHEFVPPPWPFSPNCRVSGPFPHRPQALVLFSKLPGPVRAGEATVHDFVNLVSYVIPDQSDSCVANPAEDAEFCFMARSNQQILEVQASEVNDQNRFITCGVNHGG